MFHVVIHAMPDSEPRRGAMRIGDRRVKPIQFGGAFDTRFQCSFDEVERRFAKLPRMCLEPDGSFVWVVETAGQRHQVDGNLLDDGERLLNVELKAECDTATLDRLLEAFGWPSQQLLFQLVQYGVYLDEADFRQLRLTG